MPSRRSLAVRIAIGFAVVVAICTSVGLIAVVQMRSASNSADIMARVYDPASDAAAAVEMAVSTARLDTRSHSLAHDQSSADRADKALAAVRSALVVLDKQARSDPHLSVFVDRVAGIIKKNDEWIKMWDETKLAINDLKTKRNTMVAAAKVVADNTAAYYKDQTDKFQIEHKREDVSRDKIGERVFNSLSAGEIDRLLLNIRICALKALLDKDGGQVDEAKGSFIELETKVGALIPLSTQEVNRKQLMATKEAANNYRQVLDTVKASLVQINTLNDARRVLVDSLMETVSEISADMGKVNHSNSEQSATELAWSYRLQVIGLLGALSVAIVLTILLTRSIAGPLRALALFLGNGATQVSSASGQVSDSSQRLSQGASTQASSLEETSASLEQLAANTRQNADNARQADSLAQEANHTAMHGESEARRIAGEVAGHLSQLGEAVAAIKKSTEQTRQVVETIDEIAFQTNLLALNAAVEAARAGEAGMGFAVVADEVRNLAQRSTEEVKNTTELMKQAQAATTRVMEVTVTVEGYLKKAVGEQMVSSFKQVVDGTGKVTHLMAEVSAASDEQAKGVEQINRAIAEMDKVTQENAASAEESAAASEELNSQAAEMQNSVHELTQLVEGNRGTVALGKLPNGIPTRQHMATRPTLTLPHRTTASLKPAPPRRTTQTTPTVDRSTRTASEILPLTDEEQQDSKGDFSKF